MENQHIIVEETEEFGQEFGIFTLTLKNIVK